MNKYIYKNKKTGKIIISNEEKPEKDWVRINTWKTGQMTFNKIKTKCIQPNQK